MVLCTITYRDRNLRCRPAFHQTRPTILPKNIRYILVKEAKWKIAKSRYIHLRNEPENRIHSTKHHLEIKIRAVPQNSAKSHQVRAGQAKIHS